MTNRFFVPKFIDIEDRLAGLLTFKQLFGLLAAFLLSFVMFKINMILGIIAGFISFGIAILLTFFKVNGKPLINVLPKVLFSLFSTHKFVWQKIQKFTYKEISLPEEIKEEIDMPKIQQRKIMPQKSKAIEETSIEETIPNKFDVSPAIISTNIEKNNEILMQVQQNFFQKKENEDEYQKNKIGLLNNQTEITLEYPAVNTKEKLTISLQEPISSQIEKMSNLAHKHSLNPKNPYRMFPYIKFYKALK
jgi:hypothetical protein